MNNFPDIDEFYELMNDVLDEMPEEMFRELHHGVILYDECKYSPYAENGDLIILGEYCKQNYGNEIKIYYGSFKKNFAYLGRDELKQKLREIIRHEFRHHLENLGGVHGRDSLEREDEIQIREYQLQRENRNK